MAAGRKEGTAPGAGCEFKTNAAKFTGYLVATRSTSNLVADFFSLQ